MCLIEKVAESGTTEMLVGTIFVIPSVGIAGDRRDIRSAAWWNDAHVGVIPALVGTASVREGGTNPPRPGGKVKDGK